MFSSFLDPTIEGYVTVSENDGIWTMTEMGNNLLTLTEVDNNLSSLSGNDTNDNSFLTLSDSSVSNQLSSNKIIEVLKPNQSITANFITNDAGDLILDMDSSPPVNVTESFGFCEGEGSGSSPSVEKIAQENNTQLRKDQPPSTCHTHSFTHFASLVLVGRVLPIQSIVGSTSPPPSTPGPSPMTS